ncbi:MAG TPA: DUF3638 domain-containing protein, partial [Waddliaceae bacterium]
IQEPLTLVSTTKEEIDGGFLNDVFKRHLSAIPGKQAAPKPVAFSYDPEWAQSDEERAAYKAIVTEFAHFQKDYDEGVAANQQRAVYQGKDIEGLQGKLESRSALLACDLQNLEVSILEIANALDPNSKIESSLLRESKVDQELSMKNLIAHFLTADRTSFKKANGYLTDPGYTKQIAEALSVEDGPNVVIDYLYNLIGLFLTTSVCRQRLERAIGHCKKITDTDPALNLSLLEQEDLIQKIAEELNPERLTVYDPHTYPPFLVFEYLSCFAIRPEQAKHLMRMLEVDTSTQKYRNRVIQMIMGGGKTSVLAVILLKLAAKEVIIPAQTPDSKDKKEKRLSLFVTPASQYSSAASNLRKTLKEYFDQEMEEIDIPADKILEMSREIEQRLEKTRERGDFLIVKSDTLLCLQLKFLTLVFETDAYTPKIMEQINTLRRILVMLRQSGEGVIDEVDLVLAILHEMNFSFGEKQHINPERIDLIRELFELFVSNNARLDENREVDLEQLIGLKRNQQTLLRDTDLKGFVSEAVAWKFARESSILKINHCSDFLLSFYRYISGNMNTTCQLMLDHPKADEFPTWENSLDEQDKRDFKFLSYVRGMHDSDDKEKQEAAHQIALIKHMMLTVLTTTFQKMGNRNYGRGDQTPGEVRPYLAVDTPSHNYFGYIYEWLAYHFQTVLQSGIKAPQLSALAALYREGAEGSLKTKRLIFDEKSGEETTPEAYEFKKMTQVDLEEIEKPGKIEEAVKNLENNDSAQLQLESETASDQVVYHPFRLA